MNVPQPSRLGGVKKRGSSVSLASGAATEPALQLARRSVCETDASVERWERPSINQASPLNPIWTALFEGYDRSSTKLNLEVRHPFMDVRLVEFLSSIPCARGVSINTFSASR
jgi:hypothetical protein